MYPFPAVTSVKGRSAFFSAMAAAPPRPRARTRISDISPRVMGSVGRKGSSVSTQPYSAAASMEL